MTVTRRIPLRHGSGTALVAALAGGISCAPARPSPSPRTLPAPDGVSPTLQGKVNAERIANYTIDATYDADSHVVTAKQTVQWTHTGTSPVQSLPFHLYMNAFSGPETQFSKDSGSQYGRLDYKDDEWGNIKLSSVARTDDGAIPELRYVDDDETVVEVVPESPIQPGETIELEFEFTVKLPRAIARTGHADDFALVAQWYPKIGVLIDTGENQTWHCAPFVSNNEFFADFGVYDVTLRVPNTHVVAATGVLVQASEDGNQHVLTYRAEDVHDFAWMIDPFMEMISGAAKTEQGEVLVRVYARPKQRDFARRHLRAGIGAIESYSERYLPYPWPFMNIVDPPLQPDAAATGGMEYPMFLTTGGDSLFNSIAGARGPEFVTIHEIGHNWFQGVLASNEVNEPWLDEGINEYTNGLALKDIYGTATIVDLFGQTQDFYRLSGVRAIEAMSASGIAETASQVVPGKYGASLYRTPAAALAMLSNNVGPERFAAAMRDYARTFAFKHPTQEDFIASLETSLGQELDWFFAPLQQGFASAELRIERLRCHEDEKAPKPERWRCEVVVANVGRLQVPVDIEIRFDDGTQRNFTWQPENENLAWKRYEFVHASPVNEVLMDPHHQIYLNRNRRLSTRRRNAGDNASKRYARRQRFWTQTAMQVLGL